MGLAARPGTSMQEQPPQVMPTSPLEGCFAAALSAAIAFFLQQQPCCRAPVEPAACRINSLKLCQHLK